MGPLLAGRSFKASGTFGVASHSTIVTPNAVLDYGYCHRTAYRRLPYKHLRMTDSVEKSIRAGKLD